MYCNIEKRIEYDLKIPRDVFIKGIINVQYVLFDNLERFLFKENRYFGVILKYSSNLDSAFKELFRGDTDEDKKNYNKILFLVKPLLLKEYTRLKRKRVTRADCIIVIMNRINEVLGDLGLSPELKSGLTEVFNILEKLYNNIKSSGKNINMNLFSSTLKRLINSCNPGKYELNKLSIINEELKDRKTEIEGDRTKLQVTDNMEIKEVWLEK